MLDKRDVQAFAKHFGIIDSKHGHLLGNEDFRGKAGLHHLHRLGVARGQSG